MRKLLIVLLFMTGLITLHAQTKEDAIRELILITKSAEQAQQMIDFMMPELIKMVPEVPDEIWARFKDEIKMDEFIELMVPLYDRYYTETDIKELIAFYQTPIGRKVLEVSNDLSAEAMEIGKAWGQSIAERIISQLEEEGYIDL